MDKQTQGIALFVMGVLLLAQSFNSSGGAQIFYIAAGLVMVIWGILWQR